MSKHNYYDANGKIWMWLEDTQPCALHIPTFDPLVVLSKEPKEILRIHSDRRITVTEDASPTETAKQVLEALESMIQGMLKAEYERGYNDAIGMGVA